MSQSLAPEIVIRLCLAAGLKGLILRLKTVRPAKRRLLYCAPQPNLGKSPESKQKDVWIHPAYPAVCQLGQFAAQEKMNPIMEVGPSCRRKNHEKTAGATVKLGGRQLRRW